MPIKEKLPMTLNTSKDIAHWMVEQFNNDYLYQEDVAWEINDKFGEPHVYINDNGNYAISTKVLSEFRKITEGKVVWERSEKAWRLLTQEEQKNYTSRQVD
jgi:hypothetical protein